VRVRDARLCPDVVPEALRLVCERINGGYGSGLAFARWMTGAKASRGMVDLGDEEIKQGLHICWAFLCGISSRSE
jgi:hypothetical protein